MTHTEYLRRAVTIAREGMLAGNGGPFGCVIVKDGQIVGEGSNLVTSTNDPTAHAEVVAIREACRHLETFQLEGCIVYCSCEPCPMCMGAIYWARPQQVFYASTRYDAAAIGFDDEFIYEEIPVNPTNRKIPFENQPLAEADAVFAEWTRTINKELY
jgi:tRNA(Arg) A34 adenosine deaminase TadA